MKKINYIKDTKKFWKAHKESRDAIDKDFTRRSPEGQRVITDKMRANHAAMRNAKRVTKASLKPSKT